MKIIDLKEDKEVRAEISKATKKDTKAISKARAFQFDWKIYWDSDENNVYKLHIVETGEILGLMCLRDRPEPGYQYVEVYTLELRSDQIGKNKKYGRIAGCLFGFAARMSYKNGYEGMIYLIAKTKTAPIFEKDYGFQHIGSINSLSPRMISDSKNSSRLIKEYLED